MVIYLPVSSLDSLALSELLFSNHPHSLVDEDRLACALSHIAHFLQSSLGQSWCYQCPIDTLFSKRNARRIRKVSQWSLRNLSISARRANAGSPKLTPRSHASRNSPSASLRQVRRRSSVALTCATTASFPLHLSKARAIRSSLVVSFPQVPGYSARR